MRAVRYDRFGPPDVLRVDDIPEPFPMAGEVKIRVRAASLNALDWKIRHGHLRMLPLLERPPRGLGSDFAGEVVAVASGTNSRSVGQRVFGTLSPLKRQGSLAEYITAPSDAVTTMPDAVSFAVAAALPVAGGTAVQAIEDYAQVISGQHVLITGAGGGVGHFAIQLAKHRGAHVTAVCGPSNIEFVRSLGADAVVDYTREDFTKRSGPYDVVFDAASAYTYLACRPLLAPASIYLNTGGNLAAVASNALGAVFARVTSRQRVACIMLRAGTPLWERLAKLATESVLRPHIERTIGLKGVAEAQRAMEIGHGRGKVIVEPNSPA